MCETVLTAPDAILVTPLTTAAAGLPAMGTWLRTPDAMLPATLIPPVPIANAVPATPAATPPNGIFCRTPAALMIGGAFDGAPLAYGAGGGGGLGGNLPVDGTIPGAAGTGVATIGAATLGL